MTIAWVNIPVKSAVLILPEKQTRCNFMINLRTKDTLSNEYLLRRMTVYNFVQVWILLFAKLSIRMQLMTKEW